MTPPEPSRPRPGPVPSPAPRVAPARRSPYPRGAKLRLLTGLVLIAYAVVMAGWVPMPYVKVEPGSATNVRNLITVEGVDHHPADGELMFLTVALSQRLTPFRAAVAWLDRDTQLRREEIYTGGRSREEINELNLAVMRESKLVAIKVALEHLGYEVGVVGGGALVTDVLADRPAEGRLRIGDLVVTVDGEPASSVEDVVEAVRAREPGAEVEFGILRGTVEQTVTVPTVEGDDGVAQVGIQLTDNREFEFPFEVDIDTGRVGGPSAGLAFTLAVLDELTPGELTGGHRVAVTGQIDSEGSVRPVGGVEQKAIAARRAGAVLMLVPKSEAHLAQPRADGMQVVGVETLDDALVALASIGGNALALPRVGAMDGAVTDTG